MLEAELAFCDDIRSLLSVMEHLIKKAAQAILENSPQDLALLSTYNKANIEVNPSCCIVLKINLIKFKYPGISE